APARALQAFDPADPDDAQARHRHSAPIVPDGEHRAIPAPYPRPAPGATAVLAGLPGDRGLRLRLPVHGVPQRRPVRRAVRGFGPGRARALLRRRAGAVAGAAAAEPGHPAALAGAAPYSRLAFG